MSTFHDDIERQVKAAEAIIASLKQTLDSFETQRGRFRMPVEYMSAVDVLEAARDLVDNAVVLKQEHH